MERKNELRVEQYDVAEIAKKKKILKKVATGIGTAALTTTLCAYGLAHDKKIDADTKPVVIDIGTIRMEPDMDIMREESVNIWAMGGPGAWFDSRREPVPVTLIENQIFNVVEEIPSFPGGIEAMQKFIRENMQYPAVAQGGRIQGGVVLQFVVERDGSLTDIVVLRGVDPTLDREAIRLVESMPKWIPGRQRGREVRVRFILPINF